MKEQFVTYEIAKKLKELGFDEQVVFYDRHPLYNDSKVFSWQYNYHPEEEILAPLWQQAIDFLKKRKVLVAERWDGWEYGAYEWDDFIYTDTKEEAILKAIEICQVA